MTRLASLDLRKLNTVTKYPSIPTLHALGSRGRLTDERIDFGAEPVFVSEKVDGTNSRVLLGADGEFFIGSRNDLLAYGGDVLHNPAQGIVDVVKPLVERLERPAKGRVRVYFGESYGGRIGAMAKQYTTSQATGFRLFDLVDISVVELSELLTLPVETLSGWREGGGQPFVGVDAFQAAAAASDIPMTPRIPVDGVPDTHADVLAWLEELLPQTRCGLDADGASEGVVLRTANRGVIAKARFQDYRRTLRAKGPR